MLTTILPSNERGKREIPIFLFPNERRREALLTTLTSFRNALYKARESDLCRRTFVRRKKSLGPVTQ